MLYIKRIGILLAHWITSENTRSWVFITVLLILSPVMLVVNGLVNLAQRMSRAITLLQDDEYFERIKQEKVQK